MVIPIFTKSLVTKSRVTYCALTVMLFSLELFPNKFFLDVMSFWTDMVLANIWFEYKLSLVLVEMSWFLRFYPSRTNCL